MENGTNGQIGQIAVEIAMEEYVLREDTATILRK